MPTTSLDRYIELTPGTAGGRPRVAGRRITVEDVAVWYDRLGKSADQICADYDLTLAEVHAALAYYFDHKVEIDASLVRNETWVEDLRKSMVTPVAPKLTEPSGG